VLYPLYSNIEGLSGEARENGGGSPLITKPTCDTHPQKTPSYEHRTGGAEELREQVARLHVGSFCKRDLICWEAYRLFATA